MATLQKNYKPVPIDKWKTDALHFLYDDIVKQETDLKCAALMQRIAELEFDAEEAADAPHRTQ